MNVRPIEAPVTGEQVVAAHPGLTPTVETAGWQRRLNLYTGRHLGESALQLEQDARAGRLAMAGRAWSHGVVHGLEVAVERAEEPVEEGSQQTVVRWYLQVAPGYGLTVRGEDVSLPQHLRVPVERLQVITPAPRDARRPGASPLRLPPSGGLTPPVIAQRQPGAKLPPVQTLSGPQKEALEKGAEEAGVPRMRRPTQDELEDPALARENARKEAAAPGDPLRRGVAASFAARTGGPKGAGKGEPMDAPSGPALPDLPSAAEALEGEGGKKLELWRHGVFKPLLPDLVVLEQAMTLPLAQLEALGDPLRRPDVAMELREETMGERGQKERPRVAVLVLRPVTAELTGRFNTQDPCEQDPDDDAFADWQLADGVQVLLYAFPWLDRVPRAPEATFRNRLAYEVFGAEAALGPGEHLPWEEVGVPLGLVGFRADGTPEWVDGFAVVRDGGRPHRRTPLLHGAGDPLLWQARLKQFAEQVAEVDWSRPEANETFRSFAFMPPAGLLPRAAVDTEQWRVHAFPSDYRVEAVPVPMEQLDAAIEASAPLAPFRFDTPDRVRLLVPVPQELYDPRLLQEDVPDPQFEQEIAELTVKRTEVVLRREDVRRRAEAVVEAVTGQRPPFPAPEQDPERLDADEVVEPAPAFGRLAHEEREAPGLHQHFFWNAGPFRVNAGDVLFAWVYLDPAPAEGEANHRPRTLMLQFHAEGDGWEHRAYWGENLVNWGVDGTVSRMRMGPLPEGGRWVRLEVPAALVGLEDRDVTGMAFTLFDGRAHFHRAGKLPSTELPWFRGAFPAGARVLGDAVQWVPQPRRQQGVAAHRSPGGAGFHQHFFDNAPSFLHVQGGDRVYAYVYLDPADPPSALLLQWRVGGSWEQRAYWGPPGAAGIVWGTDGTNSRRRMGDLPPAGRWVRLEVPAALVGLANQQVNGLAFGTVDGVATWDAAGVVRSRGAGLRAEYFAGRALAGPALLERVDASVDFDWGAGSPDPAVPADEFSARWTGLVVPKYNEDYTFSVPADDGVRLWVDDTLVVDRWIITAVPPEGQEGRGTIRLTAGRAHRIRLEFFEAGGAAVIRLRWSSPSTPLQVIPAGQLFPPLGTPVPETAAVALEDAWLEEALPPNASVAGSGAWSWVPHPALLPPEDAFDTADAVEGRRESLAVARLREQLLQGGVVSAAHQAELDRGLAHFVNFLDAKVKAADDYADFSFVRVQSDMYRLRQLMMGTTAATRLATSPAVAGIVRQSDSALDMRSKLADYLRYARLGTVKTAQGGVKLHAMKQDMGGGEVFNTQSLGVSSRALVANTHTALGFSPMVVSVAQPVHAATAVAWQPAPPPRTAPPAGVPAGPTVTVQPPPPPRTTAPPPGVSATVVPQAAAWASPAVMSKTAMVTRIAPAYQGSRAGAALSSVWLKAPIVGEAYDFRTVTVAERAVAPEANEAKSFSVLTRYEVLSGLARLDLPLDDLVLPGFADVGPLTFIDPAGKEQPIMQGGKQAVGHRMRRISRKAWDGDPIEMPLLVQKRFGDVKSDAQLTDLVLEVNDPTNGDEAAFFALSVELLDATTAALRAAEGRIQQYRDAADAARVVLGQAQESARAADSRLRALENELGEVRHDLAVARALYEDEKERVRQLNERRRTIVRDHVEFFAFQRPRVAFGILDAPRRPLDPAFTQSPVPACLNSSEQAPAELRAIVEVLRESPLRFFRNAGRLLGGLNTLESLRGTLEAARERARTRGVPSLLESLNERLHGGLGAAIARTLQAQQQVMLQYRHALAYVDWGWLHHALWSRLQDEALQHLSLGDVIDAAHGRTSVDRGASRELDDVLKIATCLYREIGQVRPALRLDWAEAVSQYDEAVDLRNLFSLPRFSEVDYLSRREMQAMVDWLYARVEPSQPEAGAMMSDVVRICILLASHAPVNTIVSATVTRETEARAGGTVELRVDPSRARVGMHVLLQDSERRPVHGVIEDMSEGLAVARVLQAGASSVKILKDARAQLGERASLDAYALAGGRPPAITARYPVARLWV